MSPPEKRIYIGTERCGLCRSQLPWRNGLSDRLDENGWDLVFRAALCLEANDENTIEITLNANLSHIDYDDQIDVRLNGHRQNQLITICHYEQGSYPNATHPTAYCFHAWCYEILIQKFERCTEAGIYKLSQILSLDSVAWERNHIHFRRQIEPASSQTLRELADIHQPLSSLLRLPVELRNMVWNYIGPKAAFSATVLVAEETTRLLHTLSSSDCNSVSLLQGSRVFIQMSTVFGTRYIQSLSDGDCPETIPGVVVYLKLAMVYGGICAVRLYGSDWSTSWLGVIPTSGRTWYGCIRRPGNTLTCRSNGLYLTSLSGSTSSLDKQILWDQPDIPHTLYDLDKELFDHNRDILFSQQQSRCQQTRCFGYLPLFNNKEYMNGLTVYLSGNGIVGIESHFTQVSRLIGVRDGCSKNFSFDAGERIAFVWLCIVNTRGLNLHSGPTVTIQTTFGRIQTFGPYMLPQYVLNDEYKWILLNGSGSITGFYIEWPNGTVIMRIGVTRESDVVANGSPHLEFTACGAPFLPGVNHNAGLFMSVAGLSNLRKVEICRVGTRCTGLKLHYLQTPTAILGQWHAVEFSQHVSIYKSNNPNTLGICFRYWKSGDHQVVTDISFEADRSDDCNSSYFGLGDTIAWWFSKSDDVIRHWDGKILPVPEGNITKVK